MRFMIQVKASRESEAGTMPGPQLLEDMGKFNEEMAKAGVMLAGEGLHPTRKGARVAFSGGKRTESRGPFPFSTELVSGFWIIQVASLDEALAWARRIPFQDGEVEIRQVFEEADFAA